MIIKSYYTHTPTEIATTNLGIPDSYRNKCIEEAYRIGDQQNLQTNVKGIMSSYLVWEETKVFDLLLNNILNTVEIAFPINSFTSGFEYEIESAWFAIYKKGHYSISHHHLPSFMSFIYYLKTDDRSAPLVFDRNNFKATPHNDLLVIFPSYLYHSVPVHEGDDRICIAGNLHWRDNK